jgi:hypothetical protein
MLGRRIQLLFLQYDPVMTLPDDFDLRRAIDAVLHDPAAMRELLRETPIARELRRMSEQDHLETRWGPLPRTILFTCSEKCMIHHCNDCGLVLLVDEGDPRLCTPERQTNRLCFECAHPGTDRVLTCGSSE